jgi:hypothetical protein
MQEMQGFATEGVTLSGSPQPWGEDCMQMTIRRIPRADAARVPKVKAGFAGESLRQKDGYKIKGSFCIAPFV